MQRESKLSRARLILTGLVSLLLSCLYLAGNCLAETNFLFEETFIVPEIKSFANYLIVEDGKIELEPITKQEKLIGHNDTKFVKKNKYWGSYYTINDPKAKLTYKFTGTKVEILGQHPRGSAKIYVDGREAGIFDSRSFSTPMVATLASGLENKSHILEIVPAGDGTIYVSGFISSIQEYPISGTLATPLIILPDKLRWGKILCKKDVPEGTSLIVDVTNLKGKTLLSDVSSGTDISGLRTRGIMLRANFATTDPSLTPSLEEWSVSYIGKPEVKEMLSGIIIKTDGQGISKAKVMVLQGNNIKTIAETDTQGKYTISGLLPGKYDLEISASGYLSNVFGIEIPTRLPASFLLYKPSEVLGNYLVWEANPVVNILKKTKHSSKKQTNEINMESARNEYEPCQLVITPSTALRLEVRINPLTHATGKYIIGKENIVSNFVGYVWVHYNTRNRIARVAKAPALMPDPLLLDKVKLLNSGENQPIWVTIKVPKDAIPGDYKGDIELISQYGIRKVRLNLHVYPFALKDAGKEPHVWGACYHSRFGTFSELYGPKKFSPEWWKFQKDVVVKSWTDHRLNCMTGNPSTHELIDVHYSKKDKAYSYDYSKFDKYLELFPEKTKLIYTAIASRESKTGKMTYYFSEIKVIDGAPGEKMPFRGLDIDEPEVMEFILSFYISLEKHLDEKGWLDRVWVALCDEPSKAAIENYKKYSRMVHEAAPKLHRFEYTFAVGVENAVETIAPAMTSALHGHLDFYVDLIKKGKDCWTYTYYPIDCPLIGMRVIPWLLYRYGLRGYHGEWLECSWFANLSWRTGNVDWAGRAVFERPPGNYWLVYPDPEKKTIINSLRYEMLREGFEDYEYLWTLTHTGEEIAKKLGWAKNPAETTAKVFARKIFPSFHAYEQDPARLYKIRKQIAQEICKLEMRPYLAVNMSPSVLESIPAGLISVSGMAEKGSKVLVDGKEVKTSRKGEFSTTVGVSRLKNYIEVRAKLGEKEKIVKEVYQVLSRDENIFQLKEVMNRAKELGIDTSSSEKLLKGYETTISSSSQPEKVTASLISIVEEIKKLRQKEIGLLFTKLLRRGKAESRVYKDMIREIEKYKKGKDYERARFLLTRALELDRNCAMRRKGDCLLIPILHHKRKAYRLVNSMIEAIIWEEGGRIITFKVDGVPCLKHNQIDLLTEKGINIGGYEDAGKRWRWRSNLEEWETKIVKDTPGEVSLSCSKEVSKRIEEGYIITRTMSVRKGDPGLKIAYTLTNPTNNTVSYTWRAHPVLGIGKAKESEGGEPAGDEFIIPADEKLPFTSYDSLQLDSFDKMLTLTKPFAGVLDSKERSAVFFVLDPLIKKFYVWVGMKSCYTLEPWLEFELAGGKSIEFTNYLVGFSQVENVSQAEAKIHRYIHKTNRSRP